MRRFNNISIVSILFIIFNTLFVNAQTERTISVQGRASVTIPADMATIQIGIRVQDKDADAALRNADNTMKLLLNIAANFNIDSFDIQTSQLSLNSVYENYDQEIQGFEVNNILDVTVRDLSILGKFLASVIEGGGNYISQVRFDATISDDLQNEMRLKALKDAQLKAELYAEDLGEKISSIQTLTEMTYQSAPLFGTRMMSEADISVASGGINVSAEVLTVWLLEN